MGGKAGEAARLRSYAKEQGAVARRLRSGEADPIFYRVERRRGEDVRVAVHADSLTEAERQRQRREAARAAEAARREANKEAKGLEAKARG